MIIGISGYGYSGASAYIDMLKEFDDMQSLPLNNEFPILQQTDGILDLKHALVSEKRRLNANSTIIRFMRNTQDGRSNKLEKLSRGQYSRISKKYIDELIGISWKGRSAFDPGDIRNGLEQPFLEIPNRIIRRILRLMNKNAIWPWPKQRYFGFCDEERFNEVTKNYIIKILEALDVDLKKNVILEQVFNTINPLLGSEFFDQDVVSVIVDRDPRDIFLLTNILFPEKCSFMPCDGSVEKFIYYYKTLHDNTNDDPRIVKVKFEDLIYNYDSTVNLFENLLDVKNTHRGRFFIPEKSVVNTRMYLRFPQYADEFRIIEKECSEYLYEKVFDEMKVSEFKPF